MKLRLTSRIILCFLALVAAVLTAVGVLSYRSGSASLKAAAISELLAKAAEGDAALDLWLDERLADADQMARRTDLVEKAAALVAAAPNSEAARSAHRLLLEELEPGLTGVRPNYTELFVIDPESGVVVASTSPAEEGKSKLGRPYFDQGKTEPSLLPPYRSLALNTPAMTAAVPLRTADGRLVAVLATRLDLAVMNALVQRRTGLRQTEDSFLINAEQFPVTQPRFLRDPAVLRTKLDSDAVRLCAARHSGVLLTPDYRGVPAIAVYRWNTKRQLGLLVKIDQAEALRPVRAFGWSVALISTLALLATAALAFLLARTVTRPLRALRTQVQRFGQSPLAAPPLDYADDEVGLLAREFNLMAACVAERTAQLASTNAALQVENAERKRTEESLRASQQLIERIIDAIPVRVFWKDQNLVYLGCNTAFARDAGFAAPSDLIGKDDFQMGWRAHADRYRADDRQVIDTGSPKVLLEEPLTMPDGKIITLLTSKIPLRGAAGEISGVLGVYLDISERKAIEGQLRKLSRAVEQSPSSIVITDRHGCIEYVNPKFCALTGYTAEEVRGRNPRLLKSGETPPEAYRQLWETIGTGQEWRGEFHNRKKNGELYWEFASISPIKDDTGAITHFVAAKEDVTQRRQIEKALAESEEKFRVQFETSRDATMLLDDGGFFDCNHAALELFGRTREEFLSKHPADLSPPRQPDGADSLLAAKQRIEAAFATGSQFFDWQNRRPDGTLFDVEVQLSRFVLNGKPALQCLVRDVTARKRMESELAAERDLLTTLLDHTPMAIYFKDRESRFVRCSRSLKKRFDLGENQPIAGMTDFDFFTKEHAQATSADEQAIIRTGQPTICKPEQETRADGRVTWALTSKVPWRDRDGRIIGTVGFSKDLTAMKQAEARLEEMHRRLAETSRLAGMADVATNILHNVGNVLSSVNVASNCAADLVRNSKVATLAKLAASLRQQEPNWPAFATTDPRGAQLPKFLSQLAECLVAEQAAVVQELTQVQKSIDHIKDIVTTQQSYAKTSGVTETLPASELVRDALHLNAAALARHDIKVTEEFMAAPPVTVDKHKVLTILVNLIQNAKYACAESGRPDKHLTVRVANGQGRVKISVQDNGIGIPPENLVRIFNHGFTTRKNGHGFGLHSGALAARELGGSLRVGSDGPGQGAVFTLELPQSPATPNPA